MAVNKFSITKVAGFLITLTLFVYILIQVKFILAPLVFSIFISLLLLPLQSVLQRFIKKPMLSATLTVVFVLIAIFGSITLFSFQVVEVFQDIPTISVKLKTGLEQVFDWANEKFGFSKTEGLNWLKTNFSKVLDAPLTFFGKGISSSTQFILDAFICFLGVFFILSYKDAIRKIVLIQFSKETRIKGQEMIEKIKGAVTKYLSGLLLVILILAILNSLGLWIIGVGYPIFFGVVASVLVIIPYFGTTIGGLIPFLYSVATFDEWWQPVAVIGMYATVQQIEGNFITPNVVGSSVKINFLVAFLALIVGGTIWGLSGIILSLPVAAIVKIICDYIDYLKPIGLLMSNDILKRSDEIFDKWDSDEYRIGSIFKK